MSNVQISMFQHLCRVNLSVCMYIVVLEEVHVGSCGFYRFQLFSWWVCPYSVTSWDRIILQGSLANIRVLVPSYLVSIVVANLCNG